MKIFPLLWDSQDSWRVGGSSSCPISFCHPIRSGEFVLRLSKQPSYPCILCGQYSKLGSCGSARVGGEPTQMVRVEQNWLSTSGLRWHGSEKVPSPSVTVEGTDPKFMRPGELALSLAWHRTYDSRSSTSSGQHSGAGLSRGGTVSWPWGQECVRVDTHLEWGGQWVWGDRPSPAVAGIADHGVMRAGDLALLPHWL